MPPTHVPGQAERPRRLPPDPRTEFAVIDPTVYRSDEAFIAAIDRELATRPRGQRNLLLFIHGYNNTTSDAILRLTQFVEDTGYQGVPVLFTWASAARATRYVYDLNSALVARVKLKDMSDILSRTGAERLDIFAHSMGAFLTMEGLVDGQQAGRLSGDRIDHIMLASPDIDIDLFRTQIGLLSPSIIGKDVPLRLCRRPRAQGVAPARGWRPARRRRRHGGTGALGLTVIDLSEIRSSGSGSHSKFAGFPEVVQLIGAGLNSVGGFDESSTPGLDEILAGAPIRIQGP